MSLDHHDAAAIDAFATDVEQTLDTNQSSSPLWELLALWAAAGGALTLAQGVDAGWLYPIGLAGVALWGVRLKRYLASVGAVAPSRNLDHAP